MKRKGRVLSFFLALWMMLSVGGLGIGAENAVYAEEDFETLSEGAVPSVGQRFVAVPMTSTVLEEGGSRFARIPFVGAYEKDAAGTETVAGNCDRGLQLRHAALNTGAGFTLEASFRPHSNGGERATVEAAFARYTFSTATGTVMKDQGTNLSLFFINLADGSLTGCGSTVAGAKGMRLDEWNRLTLTYHPADGTYEIYINGALYSRMEKPKMTVGTEAYMKCKDVRIGADQLIIAKCGKNAGAYTATDAGEATNYIDIDHVRLYESHEARVTLDGKVTYVNTDVGLDLTKSGKKLLFAEVTPQGGKTYYTADTGFEVTDGMVINTRYVGLDTVRNTDEVRTEGGVGLRYLTAINKVDYDGIRSDERIASYRLGTVILPADLLPTAELTAEALAGVKHLDIPVNEGAWYSHSVRFCHTFAGSIVRIKDANVSRAFLGVGYVSVTMRDGTSLTVFAESSVPRLQSGIMSFGAYEAMMTYKYLSNAALRGLEGYMEKAMEELRGLNVLALGDSLFGGTGGYAQSTQWVNKLGIDCSWNLTNLGTSSMTVSHTKYNNDPARGNKNSMYDWMFNGKNDFRWGSTSKHTSPHPFFHCGDISGDPNDVDLIIFEGGCNDYGTAISAPLGTVDSRDPGTFLGAWNLITERLLVDYPNAKIVFLTSWRFNGSQQRENDTLTSREYSESVITLYEEKYADNPRIALIDAGDPDVSGVDMTNTAWRTEYSTDSYHLKPSGMAVIASNVLPLLWQIVNEG